MQNLVLKLSDKIEAEYKVPANEVANGRFAINTSFEVEQIFVSGVNTAYQIEKTDKNYKFIFFDKGVSGDIVIKYSGVLDGTTGGYPYVREKTTDSFYILRTETFYYPVFCNPESKEFIDSILFPSDKDRFHVYAKVIGARTLLTNMDTASQNTYEGTNPTFAVGNYQVTEEAFGKICFLDSANNRIVNTNALIKQTNDFLSRYKSAQNGKIQIVEIPEGYGSFVLGKCIFLTKDAFDDSHQLIHEYIHTNWNPKCDAHTQRARFFDEAFTQYLVLRVLDDAGIQSREITKKIYADAYRYSINECGNKPYPILEYAENHCGDLSYSFGALALVAIEDAVGVEKTDAAIKRMLNTDTLFDFTKFHGYFNGIERVWQDYFVTNRASNALLA